MSSQLSVKEIKNGMMRGKRVKQSVVDADLHFSGDDSSQSNGISYLLDSDDDEKIKANHTAMNANIQESKEVKGVYAEKNGLKRVSHLGIINEESTCLIEELSLNTDHIEEENQIEEEEAMNFVASDASSSNGEQDLSSGPDYEGDKMLSNTVFY
jgi:hypothetical protein